MLRRGVVWVLTLGAGPEFGAILMAIPDDLIDFAVSNVSGSGAVQRSPTRAVVACCHAWPDSHMI
jgi:hypothetical protein